MGILSTSTEPDAKTWIFTLMDTLPHKDFIRVLVTLWAIWHARRKAIHENDFPSPASTHAFIDRFIAELASLKPTQAPQRSQAQHIATPRWVAPPAGHCKIKVDGAVSRTSG